jgi:hypothetical protein
MRHKANPSFMLLVLVLTAVSCGPVAPTATTAPTSTPIPALPLEEPPFRSQALGYSIQTPQDWKRVSLQAIGADFYYDPGEPFEQVMAGEAVATVPLVVIAGGGLETMFDGLLGQAQDAQEMLDKVLEGVTGNQDFAQGEPQDLTVAGHAARAVDVAWSENGVEAAGRFVAVHVGDRGFVVQAVGTAGGWGSFATTLEAMLDSMVVFEPVEEIVLSEDFVGNGFYISFPAGWRVYEAGQIYMFAARQEFLEQDVPPIPVVLTEAASLVTLSNGQVADAQNAREILEAIAEAHRARGREIEVSEIEDVLISNEQGASASFRWSQGGTDALQLVAAIHRGETGFIIQAVGTDKGWETFAPVYEEMLKTLFVFEPEEGLAGGSGYAEPTSVVQAVFSAAQLEDFSALADLCDPLRENDDDTELICAMTAEHPEKDQFVETFANGKINGDAVIDVDLALVPVLIGPDSDQEETIVLIQRSGSWYLFGF